MKKCNKCSKIPEAILRDFTTPIPDYPICSLCNKIEGVDCNCYVFNCKCEIPATKCKWPECVCENCLEINCVCKNE